MSLIAELPEVLEKIFVNKQYNPQGVYGLQFCKDGEWVNVIVDDIFPCDVNNNFVFVQVSV